MSNDIDQYNIDYEDYNPRAYERGVFSVEGT